MSGISSEIESRLIDIHYNLDVESGRFLKAFYEMNNAQLSSMFLDAQRNGVIYVAGGSGIVRVQYPTGRIVDGHFQVGREYLENIVEPLPEFAENEPKPLSYLDYLGLFLSIVLGSLSFVLIIYGLVKLINLL